jgi:hypothetical protein
MSSPARISGEQYIQVLLERQAAWMAQHGHRAKYPPLLEWFIRQDDVALVDLDATG